MSADGWIRTTRDFVRGIENTPGARDQFENFDRWQWWLLEHGIELVSAGLDPWEAAVLECIVRESYPDVGVPVSWFFEGGPRGTDERLIRKGSSDARRVAVDRLLKKLQGIRKKFSLDWYLTMHVGEGREKYVATTTPAIQSLRFGR